MFAGFAISSKYTFSAQVKWLPEAHIAYRRTWLKIIAWAAPCDRPVFQERLAKFSLQERTRRIAKRGICA
jgi:hypothetical protein